PARQLRRHLAHLRRHYPRLPGQRAPGALPRQRHPLLSNAMKPFTLGYVGVGLMGGPMVKRLTSLGWSVKGYDIVAERSMTKSAAEAARGAEVVLLNLPTNDAVKQAVFGANGVAGAVNEKQLVVDFSTIPVDECRSHAER